LTIFEDTNPTDNRNSVPVALVVSVTRALDKTTTVEFVVDKLLDKITAVEFVVDKLLDKITAFEFVVDNPVDNAVMDIF